LTVVAERNNFWIATDLDCGHRRIGDGVDHRDSVATEICYVRLLSVLTEIQTAR
jgi:hypothetical protein